MMCGFFAIDSNGACQKIVRGMFFRTGAVRRRASPLRCANKSYALYDVWLFLLLTRTVRVKKIVRGMFFRTGTRPQTATRQ